MGGSGGRSLTLLGVLMESRACDAAWFRPEPPPANKNVRVPFTCPHSEGPPNERCVSATHNDTNVYQISNHLQSQRFSVGY